MKINKLVAEKFGKLDGVSISLDDRVTVITGKNEAGKSSVAAFIKYMLYGFVASKSPSVAENEKKKYMPWESEFCAGELLFTAKDGKKYRAARKNAAKAYERVFDENDMPTDIKRAGEYFFGVDEACFSRTAFIGESGVSFSGTAELDEAIRNMVVSGDEKINSDKAVKKLDELRRHYLGKNGGTGEIYKLEKEIDELEETLENCRFKHKELMTAQHELDEVTEKIAFNAGEKKKIEREKQNREALNAKNTLDNLNELRDDMLQKKDALETFLEKMKVGNFVPDRGFADEFEQIIRDVFGNARAVAEAKRNLSEAEEAAGSVYSDEKRSRVSKAMGDGGVNGEKSTMFSEILRLKKKIRTLTVLAVIFTALVVTIPIGIVLFVMRNKAKRKLYDFCRSFGCDTPEELEAIVLGNESYCKMEKKAREAVNARREELEKNEAALENSRELMKAYAKKCGLAVEEMTLKESLDFLKEYLTELKLKIEKCSGLQNEYGSSCLAYKTLFSTVDTDTLTKTAALYDESIPTRDEEKIKQYLNFYTQANEALSNKERELEKKVAVLSGTLPNPGELQSRIIALSGRRDAMRLTHAALEKAISAIQNAAEKVKKEASPLIAEESGKNFSKITDGKYKALFSDGSRDLSVLEKNAVEEIDAGYLSTGTLDAAYISLRTALCKYLYKEPPILVFDDAFSHMDDERLEKTLSFLWQLSENMQIVILSCHTRERDFFEGKAKLIDFKI